MDPTKLPLIGGFFKYLDGEDINYGVPLALVGVVAMILALQWLGLSTGSVIAFLFFTAPLWLPYLTFHMFFYFYSAMLGTKFSFNSGRAVFEIKLPSEVFKSPEAMEFVLTQIFNKASPDNLMETYIAGKRPLPFSFELVSRGGDVRFYATTPKKNGQALLEALYGQYPGIEVKELDLDYTAEIPSDLKGWAMLSFHLTKKKPAPYPIKTYIDFGMDKLPKEQEKVDPMTPMLEMLGSIKPDQQLWIQFLFKAHRESSFKNGQLTAGDTWEKDVKAEIDKIMKRDSATKAGPAELEGMPRLTTGERDTVEAMERNVSKEAFEFACRVVYLGKGESNYDGSLIGRFLRSFAATEIKDRNGIGPRWRTDFNYKFISDPFGKRLPALKKEELGEYKKRKLDPKVGAMQWTIMTTEEIATIFHLPGQVALTPTLNRVPSTRGEAPSNLPIGTNI